MAKPVYCPTHQSDSKTEAVLRAYHGLPSWEKEEIDGIGDKLVAGVRARMSDPKKVRMGKKMVRELMGKLGMLMVEREK